MDNFSSLANHVRSRCLCSKCYQSSDWSVVSQDDWPFLGGSQLSTQLWNISMLININPPVVFRANNLNLKPGVWKQRTLCHVLIMCHINVVNTEPWNHREWLCTLFWSKKSLLPTLNFHRSLFIFNPFSFWAPDWHFLPFISQFHDRSDANQIVVPEFLCQMCVVVPGNRVQSFKNHPHLCAGPLSLLIFASCLSCGPSCLHSADCIPASFHPSSFLFEDIPGNYSSSTHTHTLP